MPKDGKLYIIGEGTASSVASTKVSRWDPLKMEWTVAPAPLPVWRCDAAAVTAQCGTIYVIGGREGVGHPPATNTVVVYNPDTNTWTSAASLNTKRAKPAAAVGKDGKIYVFGGTDDSGNLIPTIEVMDPHAANPVWSYAGATLPSGSSWRATAVHDGTIYLTSNLGIFDFNQTTGAITYRGASPFSAANFSTALTTGQDGNIYNFNRTLSSGTKVSDVFAPPNLTALLPAKPMFFVHNQPEATSADGSLYAASSVGVESYDYLQAEIAQSSKMAFFPFDGLSFASAGCNPGPPVSNAVPWMTAGRVGGYVSFPGGLTYAGGPCFNVGAGSFSVDFWIRHRQASGLGSVFDYRDANSRGIHVAMYNGKILLQMATGSGYGQWSNFISAVTLPHNQWAHVAFTVDRSTTPGKGYIWVNGACAGTFVPMAGNMNSPLALPPPMRIGLHKSGSNNYNGDLDEMRFYSKALTWHEVRSIFLAGQQGKKP